MVFSSRGYCKQHNLLSLRPAPVLLPNNQKPFGRIPGLIKLGSVPNFPNFPVANRQVAGLIKPSVFKPVLATIENTLVLKQLGALQDDDRHTLNQILQDILGINWEKKIRECTRFGLETRL